MSISYNSVIASGIEFESECAREFFILDELYMKYCKNNRNNG